MSRTMPPDRWQQISLVYHAALTREENTRTAFVREACAGDEALRRDVESLLAQLSGATGFLSTPAVAMAGSVVSDSQPTMLPTADGPHGTPNDASRLEPGQRFGPYRIERLLGRGGMGEVYEAEHLEHGRRVALKVLSQRLNDPTDRARFLREGQLAASVSHPHTVYIYSSEEIAGMPVIAMELLPGGTLKDRVEKQGPLAPIEAIDAMLQVVSGLEAAHAAGILHRDIKPSNCFVDADGTIKIGDFGLSIPTLAGDVTQLTVTGTVQGTPQFASPEQLRGQSLDVRSDIYAVGATLYYLLTGRPPFDDRNVMVLVSRIATEPPPLLRKGRPEIPRALAATVLQCLAKDPAHRPTSYRSLASVLEPLGSSIKTPAPLGIRFAAGLMDGFFSQFLLISPAFVLLARSSPAFGARPVWEQSLRGGLLRDHRERVGRITGQGAVWPPSGDGQRRTAAVRASSPSCAGLYCAPVVGIRPGPVDRRSCVFPAGQAAHGLSSSPTPSSVRCFFRWRAGRMDLRGFTNG